MRDTLILALAAAALAGCGSATEPEEPPPRIAPLPLRVEPARTTVVSGDTVTVRLSALNESGVPVAFVGAGECRLTLALEDPQGRRQDALALNPTGCRAGPTAITLAPGDSLVEVKLWEAGVLIGGDAVARAARGTWTLLPRVIDTIGPLDGSPGIPATVAVVAP